MKRFPSGLLQTRIPASRGRDVSAISQHGYIYMYRRFSSFVCTKLFSTGISFAVTPCLLPFSTPLISSLPPRADGR